MVLGLKRSLVQRADAVCLWKPSASREVVEIVRSISKEDIGQSRRVDATYLSWISPINTGREPVEAEIRLLPALFQTRCPAKIADDCSAMGVVSQMDCRQMKDNAQAGLAVWARDKFRKFAELWR